MIVGMPFAGCSILQRQLLFYPTHHRETFGLTPWLNGDETIGYCRPTPNPETVWLLLHGNGGQAADRAYALPCFSSRDAVYILEYPGYGQRKGTPSKDAFDKSATDAYRLLRHTFPDRNVCLAAESIGSGPGSLLAREAPPPDKIVLVVPFDTLARVGSHHYPYLPVRLLLGKSWDNVEALSHYAGPIEIFGAREDRIIPVEFAQALAAKLPKAEFHLIEGGHNDWARPGRVEIRYR